MTADRGFFRQDALVLAPALVGMTIVRTLPDNTVRRLRISETEAYCGAGDTACHAHMGKTRRNEILWRDGGTIYVYLCYGIHKLMNIVCGEEGDPQAVLIRCCEGFNGPGKLTKELGIDLSFNGGDILGADGLYLEERRAPVDIISLPRVGIGYADPADRDALRRFKLK